MYFSELLTKITVGGQNQVPDKRKAKMEIDIMQRAIRNNMYDLDREKDIVCRVINGNKIKKRKYHKEEKKEVEEK